MRYGGSSRKLLSALCLGESKLPKVWEGDAPLVHPWVGVSMGRGFCGGRRKDDYKKLPGHGVYGALCECGELIPHPSKSSKESFFLASWREVPSVAQYHICIVIVVHMMSEIDMGYKDCCMPYGCIACEYM